MKKGVQFLVDGLDAAAYESPHNLNLGKRLVLSAYWIKRSLKMRSIHMYVSSFSRTFYPIGAKNSLSNK